MGMRGASLNCQISDRHQEKIHRLQKSLSFSAIENRQEQPQQIYRSTVAGAGDCGLGGGGESAFCPFSFPRSCSAVYWRRKRPSWQTPPSWTSSHSLQIPAPLGSILDNCTPSRQLPIWKRCCWRNPMNLRFILLFFRLSGAYGILMPPSPRC